MPQGLVVGGLSRKDAIVGLRVKERGLGKVEEN